MNYWDRVTMKFNYAELVIIRRSLSYQIADIHSENADRALAEKVWQKFDSELRKHEIELGD